MSTNRKLMRWSGMSGVLGALLTFLTYLVHPIREDTATILGQTWRLVLGHTFGTTAYLFILLALVGVYVYQAEACGRLGLAGFLLAFGGTLLFAVSGDYGFLAPVLAARAPELLAAVNAYPPVAALNGLMIACTIAGFACLGIATVRAGVLPRWCGWLLAAGGFLMLVGIAAYGVVSAVAPEQAVSTVYVLVAASATVQGLGLAGAGYRLWTQPEPVRGVFAAQR